MGTVFSAIQALCHKIYHIRRGLDSDSNRADDAIYGFEEMGKRAARDGTSHPLSLNDTANAAATPRSGLIPPFLPSTFSCRPVQRRQYTTTRLYIPGFNPGM